MKACTNAPMDLDKREMGTCHICHKVRSVGFCPLCCHWFCRDCSSKWFFRALEALRERVLGRRKNCCGPEVQ